MLVPRDVQPKHAITAVVGTLLTADVAMLTEAWQFGDCQLQMPLAHLR